MDLPAKEMKVVGGSGAIRDLHVAVLVLSIELLGRRKDAWILVTKLKIPLHSPRRVLRTLPVIAVGQT